MSSKSQTGWQPPFSTDYKLTLDDESFKRLMNMDAVSHAMTDLYRGQRVSVKLSIESSQNRLFAEFLEQQLKDAAVDIRKVQQYFITIEPSGKDKYQNCK